jgi:hypothetical protein
MHELAARVTPPGVTRAGVGVVTSKMVSTRLLAPDVSKLSAATAPRRGRRSLAVAAGELRARYAVQVALGRREEALGTLGRWAREVARGGGAGLELTARVLGGALGDGGIELELSMDEQQLPQLLALLRAPSHARCATHQSRE